MEEYAVMVVEDPPNLDTWLADMKRKTSGIYASRLFENENRYLLGVLCRQLSATPSGILHKGWEDFAGHLELNNDDINLIKNWNPINPTKVVLEVSVSRGKATLSNVIEALQEMDRWDVIDKIKIPLNSFIENIQKGVNSDDVELKDFRFKTLVRASSVFMVNSPNNESIKTTNYKEKEALQQSIPSGPTKKKQKSKYAIIVMLTFADDGEELANRIANLLRSKQPRIGVVILEEHRQQVESKGERLVQDCVTQANYVIPIMTRGYIKKIRDAIDYNRPDESKDSQYVRQIYNWMSTEYINNECCNERVRCIVPEKEIRIVRKYNKYYSTLQVWYGENYIETFIKKMISRKL